MEDITTENTAPAPRPFGYWLRVIDAQLTREFAAAFEAEGITRRDWRILNLLSGDVVAPELAERLQHRGGKKLRGLIERGWVAEHDGGWTLTDEGRAARERLGETVDGIRSRVAGAVSDDDFATTMTTLEAIARELGGDADGAMPRGPRGHRGFGRGHHGRVGFGPGARGFGPAFAAGFGPRAFGPEGADAPGGPHPRHDHPHHGHPHHGAKAARAAQRAYERGFGAGFDRGAATRES